jgi:hypothetical protein
MDDEEIENKLKDATHLKNSGYMNLQHYEVQKWNVVCGLIKFGNLFAMALGFALFEADLYDSVKIMRYWHQLCEKHALIYKMSQAKEEAERAKRSKIVDLPSIADLNKKMKQLLKEVKLEVIGDASD